MKNDRGPDRRLTQKGIQIKGTSTHREVDTFKGKLNTTARGRSGADKNPRFVGRECCGGASGMEN